MRGFVRRPGPRFRRWGTVRLRMTLWNVAMLAMILGVLGVVVRYTVQTDLFETVDRLLAERAHPVTPFLSTASASDSRREPAAWDARPDLPRVPTGGRGTRRGGPPATSRSSPPVDRIEWPDRAASAVPVSPGELTSVGEPSPLPPRVIPRSETDRPVREPWKEPWDRHSLVRSFAGQEVYSTVRVHGAPVRVLSLLIERRGKKDRVLQLAYPLDGVLRELDELTSTLLALVPLGLLAAGLGGAFLTGRALRPVRGIADAAARLGMNDLSDRLPVTGRDEFSDLAASFNAMLARLEETFDRQRRFTADASHELRTPLSIIKANTSRALERAWPADRYREMIATIDAAADRQTRIVEELLFLARADAGGLARDVGPVCLIEVLEEAADAVKRANRPGVRLEAMDPDLMVPGSGSELYRLFANLLENAVRHTPPQGTIAVSAVTDPEGVTVTVSDTGEGIPPEHLPHLGERFYRVDAARSATTGGTGLGLAICRSIVQAHDGRMAIESKVGEGTSVRVRLPFRPPGAPLPSGTCG